MSRDMCKRQPERPLEPGELSSKHGKRLTSYPTPPFLYYLPPSLLNLLASSLHQLDSALAFREFLLPHIVNTKRLIESRLLMGRPTGAGEKPKGAPRAGRGACVESLYSLGVVAPVQSNPKLNNTLLLRGQRQFYDLANCLRPDWLIKI